jgi:hypothetical protein
MCGDVRDETPIEGVIIDVRVYLSTSSAVHAV